MTRTTRNYLVIIGFALSLFGILLLVTARGAHYVFYPELTDPMALRVFWKQYASGFSMLLAGWVCLWGYWK